MLSDDLYLSFCILSLFHGYRELCRSKCFWLMIPADWNKIPIDYLSYLSGVGGRGGGRGVRERGGGEGRRGGGMLAVLFLLAELLYHQMNCLSTSVLVFMNTGEFCSYSAIFVRGSGEAVLIIYIWQPMYIWTFLNTSPGYINWLLTERSSWLTNLFNPSWPSLIAKFFLHTVQYLLLSKEPNQRALWHKIGVSTNFGSSIFPIYN